MVEVVVVVVDVVVVVVGGTVVVVVVVVVVATTEPTGDAVVERCVGCRFGDVGAAIELVEEPPVTGGDVGVEVVVVAASTTTAVRCGTDRLMATTPAAPASVMTAVMDHDRSARSRSTESPPSTKLWSNTRARTAMLSNC